MVTWRKNGNVKHLFELEVKQTTTVSKINDLAKTKGDLDRLNNENTKSLSDIDIDMKRKAHKQLGNFMVRHSGSIVGKAFSKWKNMAKSLTRRQLIVNNVIDHWRKYQFLFIKNSFKTWIHNTKVRSMKERRR